ADRRHDGTLAGRQTIERARQFPGTQGLVCWRSKRMRHVFDVHLGAATMPAARIDELVPRDCKYPRKDRLRRPPRVTLQVNGEQRLLHDVLRVDPGSGARQLATGRAANDRGHAMQEVAVRCLVATERGTHACGERGLLVTAHPSPPLVRCRPGVCYPRDRSAWTTSSRTGITTPCTRKH